MGWNERLTDSDFTNGRRLDLKPQKPFEFELYEYSPGADALAEFYYEAFPLMRDDLVQALQAAGVDNLQLYSATLRNPNTGLVRNDYKVVNIVGLVRAADMEESEYIDMGGTGVLGVGFPNLVIDERKAQDLLVFRLLESIADVIIHESVKARLETSGFKYLRYLPCGNDGSRAA